jgi:hypothetical protein
MSGFPVRLRRYFEALQHGFLALLPPQRVQNRDILLSLYEALQREERLTVPDLGHLKAIMAMADQVAFPSMTDPKTYAQAEVFLIQTYPRFPKKLIRYALAWAFLLLARHGRVMVDLPNSRIWLLIWRRVQKFHAIEQGFVSDCIRWLECKTFSPRSILDIVREYEKFRAWMPGHGLDSIAQVGNVTLQRYLLDRAFGQNNAVKKNILGHLRTVFHYYKEAINGGFSLPDYGVKVPHHLGASVSANGVDIDRLWEALEAEHLPAMAGLMLVLILGYGLPLRALPLLQITQEEGILLWAERLPCRRGIKERQIRLAFDLAWLARLWEVYQVEREAMPDYPYLFASGHGGRRKRPVSVEYCQRIVQEIVQGVLGYVVSVNRLERGAFKQLARQKPLTEFMRLTADVPKTRLTRMMTWLSNQQNRFGTMEELRYNDSRP